MSEKKELRHPVLILEDFGRRIRLFNALGAALDDGTDSGSDLGVGLIVLVEDWERCQGDIENWFKREREGKVAP